MNIGFIGSGKVGISLARYFKNKNIDIIGFYELDKNKIEKYNKEFTFFKKIKEFIENIDIIFITVNDDNIKIIREKLEKLGFENKILIHMSGSLPSKEIKIKKNFAYSIHPMFAFSDDNTQDIEKATFSIEGDREKIDYLVDFFNKLGNEILKIESDKKDIYHLSNVIVSNLVLSLIEIGINYLGECGIEKNEAKKAIFPLIENNINNIKVKNIEKAVTGPVERADIITLKKHLKVIKDVDKDLYIRLSSNLLKLSKLKNVDKDYTELVEILRSDKK
ncbi:6-phosphogluconate dehydrogenase-like protein [Hypnocyclicus thermotrophus]|uniref:6-phosphogluconate dehydrogenase-like protein n=1 Tax=Hypnocyclicus thermotrophus TaxID=1627895 RepID=A0AA46DXV4_9FUSO|nr:Rossmann-like and DUF2520 domain-containing protein [Hypnocyclicus thermotrophus]TDT68608.1 6-phosphogluconate dehydrogenase-like protein [Hypnocyclicus thermotrophus]